MNEQTYLHLSNATTLATVTTTVSPPLIIREMQLRREKAFCRYRPRDIAGLFEEKWRRTVMSVRAMCVIQLHVRTVSNMNSNLITRKDVTLERTSNLRYRCISRGHCLNHSMYPYHWWYARKY
jgi:hypothetical protein